MCTTLVNFHINFSTDRGMSTATVSVRLPIPSGLSSTALHVVIKHLSWNIRQRDLQAEQFQRPASRCSMMESPLVFDLLDWREGLRVIKYNSRKQPFAFLATKHPDQKWWTTSGSVSSNAGTSLNISSVGHCTYLLKSPERIEKTNCRMVDSKSRTID